MIKIKYILVSIIIVIIGVIVVYKFNNKIDLNKNISINSMETNRERITLQNTSYTIIEIAELLLNKNSNWSDLPLSDSFIQKYNSNDGVLGEIEFDSVEIRPYNDGKYPFEDYAYFVVSQGEKKTAYEYDFKLDNNGQLIDDIIFPKVYYLTDENGRELDARLTIDESNYKSCFYSLAWGHEDELSVAVTDSFHKKYPFFLDIFEHYSPLRFNHIEFVPEKSSWDKQEAYFIVDSKLECKKRYYRVKFTLDAKGYLDDVKVNNVNEEEYDNTEKDGGLHIFYVNSNWDGLNLTNNFRSKFQPEKGVFPDIDKLGYNFSFDSTGDIYQQITIDGNANVNQINGFKINDKMVYYLYQVFKDENGNIDNVEYEKLPYYNISLEEAKELYIKEHN